jgi:hypothetical protein
MTNRFLIFFQSFNFGEKQTSIHLLSAQDHRWEKEVSEVVRIRFYLSPESFDIQLEDKNRGEIGVIFRLQIR